MMASAERWWDSGSRCGTNLRCDGQSGAETVHRFVVLPAQVEQNPEPALELRVYLGGVRISRLEEQILDVGKQSSVLKQKKRGQIETMAGCWISGRHEHRTHSGSSDPNLSLSLSRPLAPSFWRWRWCCSHTEPYLGLCFSQSRRVSQACLCRDSLVKLTANAIRAVRLSFFSSIHLKKERGSEERRNVTNLKSP